MIWTDKVPTESGLYWLSGQTNDFQPEIIRFEPTCSTADCVGSEHGVDLHPGDLWFGPVECPARPEIAHVGVISCTRTREGSRCYGRERAVQWAKHVSDTKQRGGYGGDDLIYLHAYRGPSVGWVGAGTLKYDPETDTFTEGGQ